MPLLPDRFNGTVTLDATCVGRDAGKIAEEVIAHLTGLVGGNVSVSLEISAEIANGVPDHVTLFKPLAPRETKVIFVVISSDSEKSQSSRR